MSNRPHKGPCGCWSTDTHWTTLCEEHKREHEDTRRRWAEEKLANSVPRNYTTEPETRGGE
jgi:hypothetical protein